MADIGLRPKMLVKDVMSSPVITITEEEPANVIAEQMKKSNVGSIIVIDAEDKPRGIITEKDLVVRVLTKNVKPDSIRATIIMTSPLITIEPDSTISEAARKMSKLNIRRLGVIYKEQLIGLITSRDILAVMPELIETVQEHAIIESENRAQLAEEETTPLTGYCDRCRSWSENLKEVNGEYLCENCGFDLEGPE